MNMKIQYSLSVLFLFVSLTVYSQVPAVSSAACVECGGMNGNHKTWCKYYNSPAKSPSASSGSSLNLQQQIMLNIFSQMLNNAVSNNNKSAQQKGQELVQQKQDEAIRQQQLAILLIRQKKYNDSIAQANHDKMMSDYKPLDGSGDLSYKGLDDKPKMPTIHFNCKITSFSGNVKVVKSNGQEINLSGAQSVDLTPGDWIATGADSRVKLHYAFEKDGEEITLGSKSVVTISVNDDGTHSPTLMRGDMYAVNKSGMEQVYHEGGGIMDQAAFEADKLKAKIKNRIISKMNVRTPSAICGIRGTEFTVNVDEFENTEVNVKEGIVDLTENITNKTIALTAGTKGIVKASGEIIGPLEMDKKQFDERKNNW